MRKQPRIDVTEMMDRADAILEDMAHLDAALYRLRERHKEEIERINNIYVAEMSPIIAEIHEDEESIKRLMKTGKEKLFSDGDIVYLTHGNLLHAKGDHVVIPRDALAKCEEQGFADVIKIAKSLDREAIEKWTDERLVLIGAERKPVEAFNYEIRKEANHADTKRS